MTNDVVALGRLLPATNKIHENQLIMNIEGGELHYKSIIV